MFMPGSKSRELLNSFAMETSHYGKEYKTLCRNEFGADEHDQHKKNTRNRLRESTRHFAQAHRQLKQERQALRKKFDTTMGAAMTLPSNLIENIYTSLNTRYPEGGVQEWKKEFLGMQSEHYIPTRPINQRWVEKFLAPKLGISPKDHPYGDFLRVLGKSDGSKTAHPVAFSSRDSSFPFALSYIWKPSCVLLVCSLQFPSRWSANKVSLASSMRERITLISCFVKRLCASDT